MGRNLCNDGVSAFPFMVCITGTGGSKKSNRTDFIFLLHHYLHSGLWNDLQIIRSFERQAEFWLNILVYYLFFGLLYLIFNSRKVSITVGSILWCIIGIANYYVLSFKGAPIVPSDIMSAQTAANVAENYTYSIQPIFVWNVLFLLLYLAVLWRCPSSKKLTWKKRIVSW